MMVYSTGTRREGRDRPSRLKAARFSRSGVLAFGRIRLFIELGLINYREAVRRKRSAGLNTVESGEWMHCKPNLPVEAFEGALGRCIKIIKNYRTNSISSLSLSRVLYVDEILNLKL